MHNITRDLKEPSTKLTNMRCEIVKELRLLPGIIQNQWTIIVMKVK